MLSGSLAASRANSASFGVGNSIIHPEGGGFLKPRIAEDLYHT